MNRTILVTGANGNINTTLIPQLLDGGAKVRAVVRNASKAGKLRELGCQVVVQDLDKPIPKTLFDGIDAAFFLTSPNPNAAKQMHNLIEAAKGSKAHIVRLSALKAAPDAPTENGRAHHASDEELKASGLTYTILRPHFFFQNMMWSMPTIQKEGKIYQGMGDARLGMIDVRDVADCAAAILLEGGHENEVLNPTGPASISWHDVAKEVGKTIGSPVQYVPIPPEAVHQGILDMGMGEWSAKVMMDYATAYAKGWGDFTTKDVQTLTGHKPRSAATFCEEVVGPMVHPAR